MPINKILVIALILIVSTGGTALAAHPLISDDAGTLSKGIMQFELNGDIGNDKETSAGSTTRKDSTQVATTLGIGVSDKIDLTVGFARPWGSGDTDGESFDETGSADFSLSMKWQVLEHEGFSVAVKPQLGYSYVVNSPDSDNTTSYGATLIFSEEMSPFWLHLNVGYTYNDYNLSVVRDANRPSIWSFSFAATYDWHKNVKLVSDIGCATNPDKTTHEMQGFGLVGAIYQITHNIALSAGLKVGLTELEEDLTGTIGLTILF